MLQSRLCGAKPLTNMAQWLVLPCILPRGYAASNLGARWMYLRLLLLFRRQRKSQTPMTQRPIRIPLAALLFAGAILTGCTQTGWPQAQDSSFTPPAGAYAPQPASATLPWSSDPAQAWGTPAYAQQAFPMVPPIPGVNTGTEVGMKAEQIRTDLRNLQANVQANSDRFRDLRQQTEIQSQAYHGLVAAVSARLQVGTTPGNPILVQQWNEAQAQLDRVNENIGQLNNVATMVAANSSVANYMLESVKATYSVSGAIDEDHRQLRILEDDINRTTVMIERLLRELSEDVSRQTAYIASERSNLTTLSLAIKNGELYGMSLGNRSFTSQPSGGGALRPFEVTPPMGGAALTLPIDPQAAPLIVIRFDKPVVNYERQLYGVLSRALERKPDAMFNLVAVSPARGNPAFQALSSSNARKYAEQVLRSLTDMGLRTDRVALSMRSSGDVDVNEVQLFVR